MAYINEDFMLESAQAQRLYHGYAEGEPIIDYHCHLSPRDLAEDRRFENLQQIWLEGDHYKWRAMRANGIEERLITGDAEPYEKFLAWARTVPMTLGNPLYYWTHLELKRYFGIEELLDEQSAPSIWSRANEQLQGGLTAHEILRRFKVEAVCTTDDPADTLEEHAKLKESPLKTQVLPAFRPDNARKIEVPVVFNQWVSKLAASAKMEIQSLEDFLQALKQRHQFFHSMGCRLSDHGMSYAPGVECSMAEASAVFHAVRRNGRPAPYECEKFAAFLTVFFGRLDVERDWTSQLHLGALRNVNSKALSEQGPDTGYDSIGDFTQSEKLGWLLDRMESNGALSRMILYNLNPADNYVFATMAGNFSKGGGKGGGAGRMQYGSSWWFMDQKEGMEWQLNALANTGLLSRFVGMLTDSRSFMSYPRHECFRRVLCNLLGSQMQRGLLPDDEKMVGGMVRNICCANAREYFRFPAKLQG